MLVFFDVLHVDGEDLLGHSYESRRSRLENMVTIIPGLSILARRVSIDSSLDESASTLQRVFAQHIADFEGQPSFFSLGFALIHFKRAWS